MQHGTRRSVLLDVVVLIALAAVAPSAGAAIAPTLSLNQSADTTAGSTDDLGVDLKFASAGSDCAKAKAHKLTSLRLTVITHNTRAKRNTIHIKIRNLG
jgi:hypothetical protein